MGEIINKILDSYTYVIDDLGDVRTRDLPLMSSPLTVVILVCAYLKFCTSIGPALMKNRKPFELKGIINAYNIFQILFAMFLVYEGLQYFTSKDYNFFCDPITVSENPGVDRTARSSWYYFFAKMTELLETVFFVLRKKHRQVSTLHLYHHSMVTLTAWLATKYFPVGPIVLVGTLNSFIHVLMYIYYFLAGLGPQYQKYLWWKKHLTLLQLIQFAIVITHNTIALFHDCNYPKIIHIFIIVNTSMVAYMFSTFYYHNYIKTKPKKTEVKEKTKSSDIVKHKRKSVSIGQ